MGGGIFVTSFKGGVGKTTVCANLAGATLQPAGRPAIDLSTATAACGVWIPFSGWKMKRFLTWAMFWTGAWSWSARCCRASVLPSLSFLPAPMNCRVPPARTAVAEVIGTLRQSYDYVLIGSSAEESGGHGAFAAAGR